MEEILAIKPDLCFLWDEAWYAFAVAGSWARQRRTAMVAAQRLEERLASPGYAAEYAGWRASMAGISGAANGPATGSCLTPSRPGSGYTPRTPRTSRCPHSARRP